MAPIISKLDDADTGKDDDKNGTASRLEGITIVHLPAKQVVIIPVSGEPAISYPDVLNQKAISLSHSKVSPRPKPDSRWFQYWEMSASFAGCFAYAMNVRRLLHRIFLCGKNYFPANQYRSNRETQ